MLVLDGLALGPPPGGFAKREERFGFSQVSADEIIDQIPDLLKHAEFLYV